MVAMEMWLKPFTIRDAHGCYLGKGDWKSATLVWGCDSAHTLHFATRADAEDFIKTIPFRCDKPYVESLVCGL